MRLAAADLHDRPRVFYGGMNVVEQPLGQLRVVELIDVLHSGTSRPLSRAAWAQASPNSLSSSPSSLNRASVSIADFSSSCCSANPTCTIVYSPTSMFDKTSSQTCFSTTSKSTFAIRV